VSVCQFELSTLVEMRFSPDASMIEPNSFIAPRNGFAMPFRDFLLHLKNVLDQLGLSIHARTNFIKYVILSERASLLIIVSQQ